MSNELPNSSSEPTKADTAASDACTRSGTFALGLSVVLFLLIPFWEHREKEIAFAHYLSYRENLTLGIDALDENPAWQKLKDSNGAVESMSLVVLPNRVSLEVPSGEYRESRVFIPPQPAPPTGVTATQTGEEVPSGVSPNIEKAQRKQTATPKTGHGGVIIPVPPTGLTAKHVGEVEIPEIPRIVDNFKKLNDSNLLTESRGYSNFYDLSIVRWVQRRSYLVYRNAIASGCATKEIETPHKGQVAEQFVPAIDTDVLLACLSLRDVRELAQFEQPTMTPTQIGERVGRLIDITPGTLPRELPAASLVAQALLLFVIIYFGAFAREATSSQGFPVQGTLFSAFSRSRWTLLVLLLALWIPFVASLAVAIKSRHPLLGVGSALILVAVYSTHVVFQRMSYFGALNPRKWMGRSTNGTCSRSEANEQNPDQSS